MVRSSHTKICKSEYANQVSYRRTIDLEQLLYCLTITVKQVLSDFFKQSK